MTPETILIFMDMKKFISKAMAYAAMLLMTTVFYACKDDEGPSADTFIGVWEGVEADSWSIMPGYVDDGWWAERPDKNEKYGVDISEYRIEFTADKFYRIYREYVAANPRDNKWSMMGYGKWSNSENTITLTSYDSGDETYNEESPKNFKIVELDKNELILEYHENRPDGENYGKITLRQIADKGDIYEEEVKEDDNKDEDSGKPIKNEDLIGEWIEIHNYYENDEENDYDFNDYRGGQMRMVIEEADQNKLYASIYFYQENINDWKYDDIHHSATFEIKGNKVTSNEGFLGNVTEGYNCTMSIKGDELTVDYKDYRDGDYFDHYIFTFKKKK